jgi:transposase
MGRFVEAAVRDQASFLPARLDDYVDPDNPVRVIDAFVDELDLAELGFARVQPASTGSPGYAPGTMLKLYVYGYLHQLTSSRKLEREAGRNIELMWLTGKLVPDFKTIADFRRDNAGAIQIACQRFVAICCALGLVGGGHGRDRRVTPAGGEHAREELHQGQAGAPEGPCRGEHRALSRRA